MINANPIGCASDENPVSQNEVRLRLPRQSLSHRHCAQSSAVVVSQAQDRAEKWSLLELKIERPEIMTKEQTSINPLVQLNYKHLDA